MNVLKTKLPFLFYLFFTHLIVAQTDDTDPCVPKTDYTALTVPIKYEGLINYLDSSKRISKKDIKDLVHDPSLLASFSNIVSNVTIYELNTNGEIDTPFVDVSSRNENYEVIYDFSQTQTLNSDAEELKSILVGVGVRMVAKVKTNKNGINLSSPFSLAANSEKIEGTLGVRVIGIGSKKINDLIPTTSDLSPASISSALQAVATIKSHMYDKETTINPQVLAYSIEDSKLDAVAKDLKINKE